MANALAIKANVKSWPEARRAFQRVQDFVNQNFPDLLGDKTVTGLWTFDRDPLAPFGVASGSAKVANLDADKLDGQTGSYYLDSANFTGTNWTDLTDAGATALHKHDHGGMDGLGDDDHTLYLLVAGSRGLSADWDAGAHKITAETFESDVAAPTAPFIVASDTLVTNLNADKFDGYTSADFPRKAEDATITGGWVFQDHIKVQPAASAGLLVGATTAGGTAWLWLGYQSTGNRYTYVDFDGDDTYAYSMRIIRDNTGANAISEIIHRGTGDFRIRMHEGASVACLIGFGTGDTPGGSFTTVFKVDESVAQSMYDFNIGAGVANQDYSLTFIGESNSGIITWMEDEDYFWIKDDLMVGFGVDVEHVYFRDTAIHLASLTDGHLDVTADIIIDLNANVDFTTHTLANCGNISMSGAATVDGVDVSAFKTTYDAHTHALNDLSDLNAGAPNDQDVVTWDNGTSKWIAQAASAVAHALGAGQTDVTITSPADNEVLAYDTGTSEWINQTAAEAGLMPLAGGTFTGDVTMQAAEQLRLRDTDTFISSPAAGKLRFTFKDDNLGAEFYSGANLMLNLRRYSAGIPTYTILDAPVYFQIRQGNTVHTGYSGGVEYRGCDTQLAATKYLWIKGDADTSIIFGAAVDAQMYYNATNLVIDPDVTGSGKVYIGATADDDIWFGNARVSGTGKIEWGDAGTYIYQSADSILSYVADGRHEFTGGPVYVGSGSPGHAVDASGELYVAGIAEFDGYAYFDNGFKVAFGVSWWGQSSAGNAFYWIGYAGAINCCLNPNDLALIVTTTTNFSKDHGHGDPTTPTFFVHGTQDPEGAGATHWWSVTHDETDALYNVGTGTHKFGQTVDVTGDIVVSGTVDGVDLGAFKTAYDAHDHDASYYTEGEVDTLLAAQDALSEMGDVNLAGLADNNILTYDSGTSKWICEAPGAAGAHALAAGQTDVTITSPADNEVLAYDFGGSIWINQTAAEAGLAVSGHTHALNDLSDLDVGGPTEGDIISRDGANWANQSFAAHHDTYATHAHIYLYRTDYYEIVAANTWELLEWNIAATVQTNMTHDHTADPEKVTIVKAGTYLVTWQVDIGYTGSAAYFHAVRLLKNAAEMPGSYRTEVRGYAEIMPGSMLVALAAADVITMEVASSNSAMAVKYYDGTVDPDTFVCAALTITRLGP